MLPWAYDRNLLQTALHLKEIKLLAQRNNPPPHPQEKNDKKINIKKAKTQYLTNKRRLKNPGQASYAFDTPSSGNKTKVPKPRRDRGSPFLRFDSSRSASGRLPRCENDSFLSKPENLFRVHNFSSTGNLSDDSLSLK
ncbi:hypothetical protein CDAR_582441 [Caerostris darwini]|uniref:Uncharacterized protein n=1 Tax=Caerostris darwini TaxID=1538125 RepID=A0AAV4RK61_9ARAC|nr:hypothetical protein CDAR_582441 [Caerostris darwini]